MFFTTVNPMDDDQSMEEILGFLGQAKDRFIQKYLETSSEHSVLVQIKGRPELPNQHTARLRQGGRVGCCLSRSRSWKRLQN